MFSTIDDVYINLRYIDGLEYFDTSKVTNMSYMFQKQQSLEALRLGSFNTSNVTDMSYMFSGCSDMTILLFDEMGFSRFDTSSVTNMSAMFSGCSSLTNLDLDNFDTSSVTNMSYMFSNSNNLKTVYVGDSFVTDNVTDSYRMFYGCTSIEGGKGTTYNSNFVDKTYAKIDYADSPGYFTDNGLL